MISRSLFLFWLTNVYLGSFSATVVQVHDGDSLTVTRNGRGIMIRLYGIDCPEKGTLYHSQARRFTSRALYGREVQVIPRETDRFGRLIARIKIGDYDIAIELLQAGLAWHYSRFSGDIELVHAEESAREAGIGIWSQTDPIPPWKYRSLKEDERKSREQDHSISGIFQGNVKSRIFHRTTCRFFECKSCTRIFYSRIQALRAGYRPCGLCRP